MTQEQLKAAQKIQKKINDLDVMIGNLEYIMAVGEKEGTNDLNEDAIDKKRYGIWSRLLHFVKYRSVRSFNTCEDSVRYSFASNDIITSNMLSDLDALDIAFSKDLIAFLKVKRDDYIKLLEEL